MIQVSQYTDIIHIFHMRFLWDLRKKKHEYDICVIHDLPGKKLWTMFPPGFIGSQSNTYG